jgi:hypothetical protein
MNAETKKVGERWNFEVSCDETEVRADGSPSTENPTPLKNLKKINNGTLPIL